MKTPILILAFLGLVCGKPLQTGSLKDDLKELLALVPTDKVLEITLDYLANDQEVREFVVKIQSEEFPKIHSVVERLKEYKECSKFINDQGVDVYAIVNEIHDVLGYPPFQPTNTTHTGVGIIGLIDDVIAALPLEELAELLDKKMQTGEFFKTLVTAIHHPVLKNMVDKVQAWPEYPEMRQILREMVVYVKRMSKLLWETSWRETQTIQDEVKEFMALFPTDEILAITLDYIANDPELHKVIVYIQSEEFPIIHKAVQYLKKYKDCLKFINDDGVDVYALIYEVNYILGLPPLPTTNTTPQGVGIYGLMNDVIAALPRNELKALVEKKLETRQHLKTLVKALKSLVVENMLKTVKTVRASPEYQKVLQIVREKGVNEESITEILRTLYGPSLRGIHRLRDELKKYMELVPTDKVLEIVLEYLANDQEVREFVVKIQSEQFPKIHTIVKRLKEYKECSKFINDQGVDVYAILNEIHDILERHPYQPTNSTRMGVGIYGLIEDVIAVLPLEVLTALSENKMEIRVLYKTLVRAIHSSVLMNMEKVRAWPEYPEMHQILREMVVPVKRMSKLLWEIFWRETQTIQEDVKEFMVLFPTDEVLAITLDYIANDPQLNKLIVYIQSEEFPIIHKPVQYLKQYKDCLKFINDNGVDVYALIYEVNYILGLPPLPTTNTTPQGVGIYGLMNDVLAALPRDDLKDLFDKKTETRIYFKIPVTAVKSPLFVNVVKTVNTVRASPEFKKVLQIVLEKGVNKDSITEIFRTLRDTVVNMVNTVRARPEYQKLFEELRQMGVDVKRIIEHLRPLFVPHPL